MSTKDMSVQNSDLDPDEVKDILYRLKQFRSMMYDSDGRIDEFVRIIEILYGISYDEPLTKDVESFRELLESVDSEKASRLEPSYIEQVLNEFEEEVEDYEKMVEQGYFVGVPSAQ